jgi:hypothetical protein
MVRLIATNVLQDGVYLRYKFQKDGQSLFAHPFEMINRCF